MGIRVKDCPPKRNFVSGKLTKQLYTHVLQPSLWWPRVSIASFFYRVNDYLSANIDHLLVDPDENLIYTRRKRRLLGLDDPADPNSPPPDNTRKVAFPADGWGTSLAKSPLFTCAEMDRHISNSGKKHLNSKHHSLPTGLRKAKAFLANEYLHDIQTQQDQRYFYYRSKCFHSFRVRDEPHNLKLALCIVSGEVEYAYCGPSCAAGKSGFCNHILALMMKVCKYSLYDCKDVRDLKDEEDENPTTACTSALQSWHKSRLDGIRSQPVMEVVISNPGNNVDKSKKTGVTCLLAEARKGDSDTNKKLQNLIESLEQHSSKIGLTQVVDITSLDTLPAVDTRFGHFPVGSFGSYQLTFTESNFSFMSSFDGFQAADHCTATEFPPYPSFPLDDCNGSLISLDTLNDKEKELLKSLSVNVIEANKLEEKTREQAECEEWMRERKLRFTASNFGKISRRQRNHEKFVGDLLAQKKITTAAMEHGKKYEPVALKEYEKYMRKMGKPVKVLKSGLFVSPKIPILGCSPDAKVIDLSCKDSFGIGEVKCPSSKFNVTPIDACDDPGFFMEKKDGKPSLKRGHVYYDQVQGLMGLTGAQWCDFIVYTSKGLSVERIKFDQDHWDTLCEKLCDYYFKYFLPVAAQ